MIHDTLALVRKMERILLVEPNYRNKYPPIGLMKISTYFKNRGDFVEFHKGLLPQVEAENFDKVFITTLFTFDFSMCVQTIRYYIAIVGIENVFVGGIAATIMPENFLREIPGVRVLTGQLVTSEMLGYEDDVNIDVLELDYDILWDISYEYPMADSYFVYTTRGCPRKCDFCAVKTLEPRFYNCNNLEEQLGNVDARFGKKKQLLIMDNNILYSNELDDTVNALKRLGFEKSNNKLKKNSNMKYYLNSLVERIRIDKKHDALLNRILEEIKTLNFVRISQQDSVILHEILQRIERTSESEVITCLLDNADFLVEFFERYHYHKITRYVDFNQGLDARLFTHDNARKLAELALKPCRIAFDKMETRNEYLNAMELCVNNGMRWFSNYLLYNYDENPEDLWNRLYLNIQFHKKHDEIQLFSFPMKYASIYHTDRNYVGEHWNKKYLRAINVILNVTSGIVAKEEDFFLRAFGNNEAEFLEILTMPDEFIRYRDFFEQTGLTELWKISYSNLSSQEKQELLDILERIVENPDIIHKQYSSNIRDILFYYSIRKKDVCNNKLYYLNLIHSIGKTYSKQLC